MAAYVTKDQYIQACKTDLYDWLLKHHASDVTSKYGSVCLRADPHIWVKKGFCGYKNFRTDASGNAVDYLMNYLGYTYPGAVLALTDDTNSGQTKNPSRPMASDRPDHRIKPFESFSAEMKFPDPLPAPARHSRNVFAFLTQARGIPSNVVTHLIDKGLLYQSEKGSNAVFINPQRDYFEIRGTNTIADRRCRHRDSCKEFSPESHNWCTADAFCERYKADAFHGGSRSQGTKFWYLKPLEGKTDIIYICESAIDAVSLYVIHTQLHKSENAVYISIGGAAKQSKIDRIKKHHACVVIATDNDAAGDDCRRRNPELETLRPVNKDWNEDLIKETYYEQ